MFDHRRGIALVVLGVVAVATPGQAIEWSSVPAQEIVLFYPGQSSWEWNLTESSHSGGPKVRQGKRCYACHQGEEAKVGGAIVAGKKLEPAAVDHPATLPVSLQTAHDAQRLYLRLRWSEPAPAPGKTSLVTVMLDDGSLKSASVGGCWSTCHDDVLGMASAAPDSKMTKYVASSRTKVGRTGGGESYKSDALLAQELTAGKYMEFWQARLEVGKPAVAVDGVVLKDRAKNPTASVDAQASREGDDWVVTLSRPLELPGESAKRLVPGKVYTLGIAVHPAGIEHRFHHVSFERTLVLGGGEADLIAAKQ
jgi:cytochrome c-type protein NapC